MTLADQTQTQTQTHDIVSRCSECTFCMPLPIASPTASLSSSFVHSPHMSLLFIFYLLSISPPPVSPPISPISLPYHSILTCPPSFLLALAQDSGGSRVLEALLVGDHSFNAKNKLVRIFKGHFADVSMKRRWWWWCVRDSITLL